MNKLILFLLVAGLSACSVQPEPLHFGEDGCHSCKMKLMDNKFGAELVTKKGKVYKFDDINCMLSFYNEGSEPKENIALTLIIDFSQPEKLIDARKAFFIHSENIKSPMASNIAAFATQADAEKMNNEWKGKLLRWEELEKSIVNGH